MLQSCTTDGSSVHISEPITLLTYKKIFRTLQSTSQRSIHKCLKRIQKKVEEEKLPIIESTEKQLKRISKITQREINLLRNIPALGNPYITNVVLDNFLHDVINQLQLVMKEKRKYI